MHSSNLNQSKPLEVATLIHKEIDMAYIVIKREKTGEEEIEEEKAEIAELDQNFEEHRQRDRGTAFASFLELDDDMK